MGIVFAFAFVLDVHYCYCFDPPCSVFTAYGGLVTDETTHICTGGSLGYEPGFVGK